MKVLFRGYNPVSGDIPPHCCFSDDFQRFDYDFVKDVNLTYSFSVLLTEQNVLLGSFCAHYPDKRNPYVLCTEGGFVQASGCSNRMILLSENGGLHKVICNGNNGKIDYALQPVTRFLHAEGDTVVKIACGSKLNVALSGKGKLFRIPDEVNVGNIKIRDVTTGREHCVILDESGGVYTFGSGSRGQLGHGTLEDEEEPTLVKALEGIKIKAIAAGGWHSCALSEEGDLYTWGWNSNGQLGIGDQHSVMATPHVVDFFNDDQTNVVLVACGTRHTIALLDTNQLCGCGWNKYKQILNQKQESFSKMTLCYDLEDFSATRLVCGPWNSVILGQ